MAVCQNATVIARKSRPCALPAFCTESVKVVQQARPSTCALAPVTRLCVPPRARLAPCRAPARVAGASSHVQCLRRRGTDLVSAIATWAVVLRSAGGKASALRSWFSPLKGWPALSPVNASLRPSHGSPRMTSGSGVVRYAFTAEDFHLIRTRSVSRRTARPIITARGSSSLYRRLGTRVFSACSFGT